MSFCLESERVFSLRFRKEKDLKGRAAGQGCGKEMDVQLAEWGSDKDGLIRDLLGLKQQNKSQVEQGVLVKVGM